MDISNGSWKHLWWTQRQTQPVTQVTVPKEGPVALSNTVCCSSLCPLRGIHNKQACPPAWLWLACGPAFMYPGSKHRPKKNGMGEKVRAGRPRKVGEKGRKYRGERLKTTLTLAGATAPRNNGLEINGLVIHTWSDAALAVATRESEHN